MNPTENNRSERQAEAQLDSIRELVKELRDAADDDDRADDAREAIQGDALSVQVRSDWTDPGADLEAGEFMILLCTGGPAVRLIGDLDGHRQPSNVRMEHQDWGTPWTEYGPAHDDSDVLEYCAQFYFGE